MSLRKIVATIFALALAGPVKAEISSHDFAKCSSMEGELARLDCFDKLAREKNLDGPQTQQSDIENKGSWVVKITNNPVDDSKTVKGTSKNAENFTPTERVPKMPSLTDLFGQ